MREVNKKNKEIATISVLFQEIFPTNTVCVPYSVNESFVYLGSLHQSVHLVRVPSENDNEKTEDRGCKVEVDFV